MNNVLLAAGASAALHKSCDLASKLSQEGHRVRCVLTPRAAELIRPQLFEALTGEPAWVSEFGDERRGAMDHVDLARWANVFCVAPSSADLLARLALGLAGDLVGTISLALERSVPRLLCPAMNPAMYASGPVQRHLGTLREDGWRILEPNEGHMACGEAGAGRLAEPQEIVAAIQDLLG
jgi:phosphopantothenoylcysteine decarboxylase/phosphopantothenate--cysteine ligase